MSSIDHCPHWVLQPVEVGREGSVVRESPVQRVVEELLIQVNVILHDGLHNKLRQWSGSSLGVEAGFRNGRVLWAGDL